MVLEHDRHRAVEVYRPLELSHPFAQVRDLGVRGEYEYLVMKLGGYLMAVSMGLIKL